ncbi:MAG: hypothetical protein Q8Q42_03495 [Nanoarchaeota archaeon]|nr:hypothetical protein [Nanoarchaeota archaeon]
MKLHFLILSLVVIMASSVVALGGIGGGGGGLPGPIVPVKKVVGVDDSIDMVLASDETVSLVYNGTTSTSKLSAVIKVTSGSSDYRIGKVNVDFSALGDVDLSDMVSTFNAADNVAVLDISEESEASGMNIMYLPRVEGHNAIVICEGAGSEANTGQGCSANEGVTEKVIYPNGYTGDYTVTSVVIDEIEYWQISGISGTGLQSYFVNLGGGSEPVITPTGKIIDLEKSTFEKVYANSGNEYVVRFNGVKYNFKINGVEMNSEYVSVYFLSEEKTYKFHKDDYQNFDLDKDGELDMVFLVSDIVYPQAEITISYYTEGIDINNIYRKSISEKTETEIKEGISAYSGTIWSRFFKSDVESKKDLMWFFAGFVLVVVFFGVLGGKIISKIWHAN